MPRFLTLFIVVCLISNAESSWLYGNFDGASLLLDARIETPATNQNSNTAAAPLAGEAVIFQLFAPAAAGISTLGFNLEFSSDSGLDFLDLFTITGKDFQGVPLVITQAEPVASAILISRPSYPANGLIATITLTALQDVPPGIRISMIGRTSLADANSQEDLLNTSQAFVDLVEADFVETIPGDINLDGSVDFTDFLIFASHFGESGPVPTPLTSRTIIIRDTIVILRIDTVTVGSELTDAFWQGPDVFADADIQLGTGDGLNSGVLSVDAQFNQVVSIDIFASGYDDAIGIQFIFRVSDRSKIADLNSTSDIFGLAFPPGLDRRNLSVAYGSFTGGVPEVGNGLKHIGSVSFRVLGALDIVFTSMQVSWSTTDHDFIYPNIIIRAR